MSRPRAKRSRRRRLLFAAGGIVVGLLMAAVLGEVILRIVGVETPARRHFSPGIYTDDPDLGWVLQPNYEGVHLEYDFEATTTTNSLGYRGPEWDTDRQQARRRILVLGDSCTFGRGVGDDETFPALLEQTLRERSQQAAVFNAGVPGYDTVQEDVVLARLAPKVRPHLIVVAWLPNDVLERSVESRERIQIMDGHLVSDVERYKIWRNQVDKGGIYRSALYRFSRVRIKRLKSDLGLRKRRWNVSLDDEALRYSQEPLLSIKRQADALKARLLLVLFPRLEEVTGQAGQEHHDAMAAFAREHDIPVLHLPREWQEDSEIAALYLPGDAVHLTPDGYARVANTLADHELLR